MQKKKIKVLYDFQILLIQKFGGISRYFHEIILKQKEEEDIKVTLFCFFSKNYYFKKELGCVSPRIFDLIKGKRAINILFVKMLLSFGGYEIFHPTYYDPYYIDVINKKSKLIITVYDMIHELYPEYFKDSDEVILNKKRCIYAADKIIAISESTKRDIMSIYPDIPSEKIDVIYLATNDLLGQEEKIRIDLPEKYVLFVGQRGGYKNYLFFEKCMIEIMKKDESVFVVCAGGGKFSEEEIKGQKEFTNRFLQYDATDGELAYLYKNAICFVFPSLYEGFGIPTLEAFSCGCPVLLCDSSSMPEVGGEASLYFKRDDEIDFLNQINDIIYDDEIRSKMIRKGYEQNALFSWDKTYKETKKLYEDVLSLNH